MAGNRMLTLICFTACLSSAWSVEPHPAYKAVPSPFFDQRQLQSEVEVPGQTMAVVPTPTVTITQTAVRSTTVIKTSIVTVVETTIVNAMTSTTIYHTVPITVRASPTVVTRILPCTTVTITSTEARLPVEDLTEDDPVKVEALADGLVSMEQVTKLQNNIDELMDNFNELISHIELSVERQVLVSRMRRTSKRVVMFRNTSSKEEFVRRLKVIVGQENQLKVNPLMFFENVKDLVETMERSQL